MLNWISANFGTILIGLGLLAVAALAVRSLLRRKKQGQSSCGCNCGCCPMGGCCCSAQRDEKADRKK